MTQATTTAAGERDPLQAACTGDRAAPDRLLDQRLRGHATLAGEAPYRRAHRAVNVKV